VYIIFIVMFNLYWSLQGYLDAPAVVACCVFQCGPPAIMIDTPFLYDVTHLKENYVTLK